MSNETKQTAVELKNGGNRSNSVDFYAKGQKNLSYRFCKGEIDYSQYVKKLNELFKQFEVMHNEERIVLLNTYKEKFI
jgi:hypothetical protein